MPLSIDISDLWTILDARRIMSMTSASESHCNSSLQLLHDPIRSLLIHIQVRTNFRTAITIPENSWARFRDVLAEFADKGASGDSSKKPVLTSNNPVAAVTSNTDAQANAQVAVGASGEKK